jgi:hypothetical protein
MGRFPAAFELYNTDIPFLNSPSKIWCPLFKSW